MFQKFSLCPDCKTNFKINKDNFYFCKTKGRFQLARCKICQRKKNRAYYEKNKVILNKKSIIYKRNVYTKTDKYRKRINARKKKERKMKRITRLQRKMMKCVFVDLENYHKNKNIKIR